MILGGLGTRIPVHIRSRISSSLGNGNPSNSPLNRPSNISSHAMPGL